MKRTHLSVGIYDQSWKTGIKHREKHQTACGTICDHTKATTDKTRVTCRLCQKKVS